MTSSLPSIASLVQLKKQAKELLLAHKQRDDMCCDVLRKLPRWAEASSEKILTADVCLADVQFALARGYGFDNWAELKKHIKRAEKARSCLTYWERGFGGTADEKVSYVCSDAEWSALLDEEANLEPLCDKAKEIRQAIARMEPCHADFGENVDRILKMIGLMRPGKILDCGQAGKHRTNQANAYITALDSWCEGQDTVDEEIRSLLGRADERKKVLVRQLIRKLEDNSYRAYPWEEEDFETTESRITHLEICAHYWTQSLRILLEEIATGHRTKGWHSTEGFNACGDAPDHAHILAERLAQLDAWLADKPVGNDNLSNTLGEKTPVKRWLVASLCKHIRSAPDMARIIPE